MTTPSVGGSDPAETVTTIRTSSNEERQWELIVDDGRVYATGPDPDELIRDVIASIRRYRIEFGFSSPDFVASLPKAIRGVVEVHRTEKHELTETRKPVREYEGDQP